MIETALHEFGMHCTIKDILLAFPCFEQGNLTALKIGIYVLPIRVSSPTFTYIFSYIVISHHECYKSVSLLNFDCVDIDCIIIGLGNVLSPFCANTLPNPMMTYGQSGI